MEVVRLPLRADDPDAATVALIPFARRKLTAASSVAWQPERGSGAEMDLAAGTVFAGYRIVQQIGTGGMGAVYLVQHPRLPRQDAMKVIHSHLSSDPVFAARFDREAAVACTLDHPSLVKVFDRGLDDGRLWITMQFIQGHDADQLLRLQGPMAADRAVRIVSDIADALDHAHAAGLVHRDVKPANILVARRGTGGEHAFLADFGIAHASGTTRQLTDTGDLLASLPYAAPEQLLNNPITGAVDIYALGCVLYELLTARRLFDQETPPALMGAVLKGPREDAWRALPPAAQRLEPVLRHALAQDPADRFLTCNALAEAARNVVAPASVTAVGYRLPAEAQPLPLPPQWMPPPPGPPTGPLTGPTTGSQQWPAQQDRRAETGPVWPDVATTGPGGGGGRRPRRWWLWAAAALLLIAALTAGVLVFLTRGLSAPESVTADPRPEGVEVRWAAVDGALEYQVHRDGELIGETPGTGYVDREVGSGVNVTYTVAAVGEGSERSALSAPRRVLSPLHPVGNLAADVDGVSVRLTWAPVTNAERYEVRRDDQVIDDGITDATFVDEVAEAGTYAYTVLAYDDAGAPPSTASAQAEVSPWLGADDLAVAFEELVPDEPGPGGWGDANCEVGELNDTATASDAIVCNHPSGIYVEYLQYPDQAALDARIALLDGLADPEAPPAVDGQGWYRQSTADADPAWEAWGFAEGERGLMEIYIEWDGHTVADLDDAWFYAAPWQP